MTRLFFLALVTLASPTFSAPPLPVPRPDQTSSAAELYKSATDDLTRGRYFDSAAARLRGAIKVGPDEFRFHLALADALVSRAASITYAEMYTRTLADAQASFPGELQSWRKAQSDPKSDEFGDTEPVPPPTLSFATKDDGKPFKLTPAQAILEISRRGLEASGEWEKAIKMAKTPEEKAETQNAQGWGLRLLAGMRLGTDDEDDNAATKKARENPAVKEFLKLSADANGEAVKAFEEAVKLAPDDAVYWQGLGDALWAGDDLEVRDATAPRILDIYQKSLKLNPKNVSLWYRVSSLLAKTDPKTSEDTLRKAAAFDANNAYPFYRLAAIHLQQTQFDAFLSSSRDPEQKAEYEKAQAAVKDEKIKQIGRQAIDDIERGNAISTYRYPIYAPPVPKTLRAAWNYFTPLTEMNFLDYARLRSLARACGGYATNIGPADLTEAIRACRAAIGLGLKMTGDWPIRDSRPGDGSVVQGMVGTAVVAMGYKTWEDLAGKYGDAATKAQVTAERTAFDARRKAYTAEITRWLTGEGLYANY